MNILEQIIASKAIEVEQRKETVSIAELQAMPLYKRKTVSLAEQLKAGHPNGIIAEFKRKSPSKGVINGNALPQDVAKGYESAGVAAMSILTDEQYFGGNFDDFKAVRSAVSIPLLRKDFIIDTYQVYETKAIGADIMLLIAANLEVKQCHELAALGNSLGLDILLELHDDSELEHISNDVSIVGINNRNLKTFKVDLQHSMQLAAKIPEQFAKIAESGISDPTNIKMLKNAGFQGFLIGENFMKTDNPGMACQSFIQELK